MAQIHPTAIVAEGAQIAADAIVGPYCTVSAEAVIGSGTELISHVVVAGKTIIGEGNRVSPFAVLGGRTQDLKFKGGLPGVKIGDNNTIREYVTINAATNDGDFTTVGNNCHILAYSHIAHCCHIGNDVVIVNACQIAGHVVIEDMATIEGSVGIVQFMRVGAMAYIGAMSKINKDVPPYMIAHGDPIQVRSFNKIGMERRGVDENGRKAIKEAYRILYRQDAPVSVALDKIEAEVEQTTEIKHLIEFCRASEKGITR
ncbi:acyl-ACP--UDP-N-acetylglucosamine O-acyltransferase [Pontiella sulfatireligans]|uniref:Acyl-[acyl-carrier-protein]--UDP-N-acetylglucosam ine O-acyltransferase n=1 Tax=Pontiella sulfatireligans TaxID=2750658 RepID=A0A6C2UUY1_9BACT|nr:acyl-ACP--UDP-N-acetylglucosamine O-acyltransferase [Pontiella sulfatireligans]VGO22927.1 Acyl-[acyl-carrier-protein]--UDP-N-acetylglucosamine O-acyltransferase [Pontiella sulfatireligans]